MWVTRDQRSTIMSEVALPLVMILKRIRAQALSWVQTKAGTRPEICKMQREPTNDEVLVHYRYKYGTARFGLGLNASMNESTVHL